MLNFRNFLEDKTCLKTDFFYRFGALGAPAVHTHVFPKSPALPRIISLLGKGEERDFTPQMAGAGGGAQRGLSLSPESQKAFGRSIAWAFGWNLEGEERRVCQCLSSAA